MSSIHKQGPQVGTFLGQPIFKTVNSESGTFTFDRVAPHGVKWTPQQLDTNEILLEPGLIYKKSA